MVEATSGLKSAEEQKLRMATSMLKIVKSKTQEHHLCADLKFVATGGRVKFL